MDFHPSRVPVARTFEVSDERGAAEAAEEMVRAGFGGSGGFKVLMPKDRRLAKRIGYTVVTTVNHGLRRTGQGRDIRYWTYHEDGERYAIVLAGAGALGGLGL